MKRSEGKPIDPGMPSRHRILYYYGSAQFDTGSPKALVGIVDLLDRAAFEPVFAGPSEGPLTDQFRKRGIEVVIATASAVSVRRPLTALRQVSSWVQRLKRLGIELVHVNGFGEDLDIVGAAWTLRLPVVLHLHNPETITRRNFHRFAASRVLTVSAAQQDEVEGFFQVKRKSDVLHNPIDLDVFHPPDPPRASGGKTIVVTVAQISHRKGIDIVVDTARLLLPKYPQLEFWLVGRTGLHEETFAKKMSDAAGESALNGRLKFLGGRTDIPDLLRQASIFFLPTRSEPFGIAVTEAMASGLPVVVSRTGGIREIVNKPDYGFSISPDVPVTDYANAIVEIMQSADGGAAMGARGRASRVGRFDGPTIGGRLNAMYRTLLRLA
jgi:glycosyltransferase involved in cell wall biosynthesis